MSGDSSATGDKTAATEDMPQHAAPASGNGEYGTLVLDGIGRIRSCGMVARQMLGHSASDLLGTSISRFLADFSLSESSPSYSIRYLAHLCAEGGWRRFEAVDGHGRQFPIELSLSRIITDGHNLYLLNMRRPAAT